MCHRSYLWMCLCAVQHPLGCMRGVSLQIFRTAVEETYVRVAARVRPLLPRERALNCCSCVSVHQDTQQVVVGTRRTFAFDVVFDTQAAQSEVYEACVAPLVEGCLQGYNATILAYGQTGSGQYDVCVSGSLCVNTHTHMHIFLYNAPSSC